MKQAGFISEIVNTALAWLTDFVRNIVREEIAAQAPAAAPAATVPSIAEEWSSHRQCRKLMCYMYWAYRRMNKPASRSSKHPENELRKTTVALMSPEDRAFFCAQANGTTDWAMHVASRFLERAGLVTAIAGRKRNAIVARVPDGRKRNPLR